MELNLSTMILEVINFLVLVWILQRFLYRPILNIIDKRKHDIEEKLEHARQSTLQAEELQRQYDQRLKSWQDELTAMRKKFDDELSELRKTKLVALDQELKNLRDKARESEKLQQAELQRSLEFQAIKQANQFAAKLLGELACPELQGNLIKFLFEKLDNLSADKQSEFARRIKDNPPQIIKIQSVYSLNDTDKKRLQTKLNHITQLDVPYEYRLQKDLLAGVQIDIGGWIIDANLKNELRAFSNLSYADA